LRDAKASATGRSLGTSAPTQNCPSSRDAHHSELRTTRQRDEKERLYAYGKTYVSLSGSKTKGLVRANHWTALETNSPLE